MALKAKITNITRSNQFLNVEFDIFDDADANTIIDKRNTNIAIDTVNNATNAEVQTEVVATIKKIGTEYKNAITKETFLKGKIGTEITL